MKAKFTRVGKRSLSVILTLMMIVSTMLVGMVTTNAAPDGIAVDRIVYLIPSDCGWDSYLNENYSLKVYYKHNNDADKAEKQGLATMTLYSKTISNKAVYTATIQDWWDGLSYLHFRVYDSSNNIVTSKNYTDGTWQSASEYAGRVYNGTKWSDPVWDSGSGDTKTPKYYYKGNQNGWTEGDALTVSDDGTFEYRKCTKSGSHEFLLGIKGDYNKYKANNVEAGFKDTDIGSTYFKGGTGNIICTYNSGDYYILAYYPSKENDPPTICASTTLPNTPSTHKITVTQPTGGNITVTDESGTAISDLKSVAEGTKFKVSAVPDGSHVLSSVSVTSGGNTLTATNDVYTMPAADVTVTATFTEKTSDPSTAKYALCGDIGAGWGTYDAKYLVDTHDTEVVSGNNNIFKRQVKIDGQKYFRLISKDGETTTQYAPVDASYENPFDVTSADSYVNKKATKVDTGASFKIPSAGTYTIYVDQSGTTPYVWVVKESVTVTYTVNAQSNDTNMGTVSPASRTCNSGDSVSFTASENSGYVFAGWYDSSSYTNKIGSDLKLTLSNVTADRTVYAKFESSATPVTVYAMNPLNSSGYNKGQSATPVSMGETVLVKDLTGNIDYPKETNTNTSYNLYKITPGDVVTIKTQLNDKAAQANYYVYAFVINGETVMANNMGSGKYTASYTVGSEDLEITPVYFNQTIKDNGDYITFYADTDEVLKKWGNTIACYAYYYDGTSRQDGGKTKPNAYEDAAYPSQPMLKNSQGQHFTVVPRYYYEYNATDGTITKKVKEGTEYTEYYPITGVTLNNYYAKGSVHATVSGQSEYLQSFDYDDFKYIADKKDADGNPLYDTIWFDNKYRTNTNSTKYKDKTNGYTEGNTYPDLVTNIAAINGWDEFYDGVNEETANKVGLLGDRDVDTNLPHLYVVSTGNYYDPNLGEWSVNWYVFDSAGKLLVIDHPSAFIDKTSSAYKLISGENGTTDYSKNPVKITFETADTRNDGRWYYANSKKVDPYNIEVFAQYKTDDGTYVSCTNKNSDTTLPFVCDTYGFSVSIDGQAVKTYTEINNTAELKVNTLPDGWIFEGWGYIRQSDGVYVPFSSTDSLQTITLSGAGKFVARFKAVPKGSVALSHSMYDGPKALKGDGVRYIKAVLTDANGNTNVYDFTTGTIQIPDVTKGCTISITLKAVCTGINEFQTWYELVDGDYQIIGGDISDKGKTGTVEYSWNLDTSDLFVGDKLTYSTLNFYSDIASKTAEATLTYNYKDRFNKDKSYIVKVTLNPYEISQGYKPSEDTIYKNAPAIDDIYKNCIWKLQDVNRVSYGVSSATIEATHSDKLYTVTIVDSKADPTLDVIPNIPLNSYLKKDDQFIIAADPAAFKYWKVVRTDDPSREVAKCFSPTFNLVIVDDYTITAVYDGTASSSVTIGDANYTREQYTDASGNKVDRLYADFIVAYMNQSHTMITKNPDKYHTGIIIEVDAQAKITVGADGKPSNYKEVEFDSVNIRDCATATGTRADIIADGYANVVTIDDGDGNSHKRIIYKHEIDNTKYNNFNRLDYFVSFKNSPANRLFVMKATYYVYYYDDNGDTVYEESKPVYFNLYDIGTSDVVTDKQ